MPDIEDWYQICKSGGVIPLIRPVFTNDGKYFLILTSLELKVYMFSSRQCINRIHISQAEEATDLYLDEQTNKVWVSRKSGKIDIIEWTSGNIETIDVQKSLVRIVDVAVDSADPQRYSILGVVQQAFALSLVEFQQTKEGKFNANFLVKYNENNIFAVSDSKEYFGFYSPAKEGSKTMTFVKLISGQGSDSDNRWKVVMEKRVKRANPAVSMAINDQGVVAVGSVGGSIELYYEVFEKAVEEPIVRVLKWHADAVLALAFSLHGEYLLSGGRERVLVLWQLGTGQNQFLPRLEHEITQISVSPRSDLYALNLGSTQALVLSAVDLISRLQVCGVNAAFVSHPRDAQLEKKRITQKKNHTFETEPVQDYTSRMYVDPWTTTKHVYVPTNERSHVQVYDYEAGEQVQVFSVASAVQLGKVAIEREVISDPSIHHMAFSQDGKWMATIDVNKMPKMDDLFSRNDLEINLKFWRRGDSSGGNTSSQWELVTRVLSPHGPNCTIASIVPEPRSSGANSSGFVTMSDDGSVRLWRPQESVTAKKAEWAVRKVVTSVSEETGDLDVELDKSESVKAAKDKSKKFLQKYGKKEDDIINNSGEVSSSIAFSSDGSLFVAAKHSNLYLYDGSTYSLVKMLPNILGSQVMSVDIMLDRILVALSTTRLVLYDLVNDCELWSVRIDTPMVTKDLVAVDRTNGRVAIALNHYQKSYHVGSLICVLSADRAVPVYIQRVDRVPVSVLRHVPGSDQFVYMDNRGHLGVITKTKKATAVSGSSSMEPISLNIATAYAAKRSQAQAEAEFTRMLAEQAGQATVMNMDSFDAAFSDSTASLTTMFDRVLQVVSRR